MSEQSNELAKSPFLTTREAGNYLRLKLNTLEKMRRQGRGPRFRKHGRRVLYLIDDIEEWSRLNAHGADDDVPPDA